MALITHGPRPPITSADSAENRQLDPQLFQSNVPLAPLNWFKTGGNALLYAQPTTAAEFQTALSYSQAIEMPVFVLGDGANILISDDGFDGLVIKPQLNTIKRYVLDDLHECVEAGAGVRFPDLITWCLDQQLIGLEEFSGIPGTVGGSVYINIHYFQFLLSQLLESAVVVHKTTGELLHVSNEWFSFGYNQSKLHDHEHYLVSATFKLKKVDQATARYAQGRRAEMIRHRAQRYPTSHTCGSFFRNFYEHEVTRMSQGKKLIYVAYYLDKIGVKGELNMGDAIVSYQHANMIVNRGTATSSDIIGLACKMQELVLDQFGILPQPECQLIGFKKNPLLAP